MLKTFENMPQYILRKISNINPLLPFYHIVSNEKYPHLHNLYKYKDVDNFNSDLNYFSNYFSSIPLHRLISYVKNNISIPSNSIHLTFDDGLKESYHIIAPMLRDQNLDATFFVATDFIDNKNLFYRHKASIIIDHLTKHNKKKYYSSVEEIMKENNYFTIDLRNSILSISYEKKNILDLIADTIGISFKEYLNDFTPYLTTKQIKELINAGFAIGAHSIDHPQYQTLTLSSQIKQTKKSLNFLADKFHIDYKAFAMPFNDLEIKEVFFNELYSNIGIDIYFGTAGMKTDQVCRNLQRFHLENRFINASIDNVIKNKYSASIFERIRGRNLISRY